MTPKFDFLFVAGSARSVDPSDIMVGNTALVKVNCHIVESKSRRNKAEEIVWRGLDALAVELLFDCYGERP
jgi:hypothetical protein